MKNICMVVAVLAVIGGLASCSKKIIIKQPYPVEIHVPVEVPVEKPVKREFHLEDVRFDFNSVAIRPDQEWKVLELIKMVNKGNVETITLSGYADERGTEAYNLELSRRRAKSVATMIMKNTRKSHITVKWYGEDGKTCEGKGEWCWSQNRRVEIFIK